MNINTLFLLIEDIKAGKPTRPTSLWVYLEDERGQPCPLAKLNKFITCYGETGGKDMVFFTCRRVPKHRKKYVINFRDLLTEAWKTIPLNETSLTFITHLILDAQLIDNHHGSLNQGLLTEITMKLNELLTRQEGTQPCQITTT